MGERLKSGARWSGAEILLNLPLRLATVAILARLLEPAEFGVFAAAVTVIEFSRPLSSLSIDHAIVQSKNLRGETTSLAALLALVLSSLVAAIIVFKSDWVLMLYDDQGVPSVLAVLGPSLPLAAAASLQLAILRRNLRFRELSVVIMIASTVAAIGSVGVALLGGGVWALVAGYYLDFLVRIALMLPHVRPRFVVPKSSDEFRSLLRFGSGTTLSQSLNFWALHGDYVVIGSALGPKPLGYYSRAYQLISTVPGLLGRVHNMVLFPAFSRAQSDKHYLGQALRVGTEATAALTLPLCAWGLVLGPELIPLLLGPGWEEAILPFQILSLGVYFRAGYRLSASIIWATGHVFTLSASQGVYGALVIVGAIIGSNWGIPGVALATLIALFAFYALLYLLTARVAETPARSLLQVHAGPLLIFLTVTIASAAGRVALTSVDAPSLMVLVGAVALSGLALTLVTAVLRKRLWGELLYREGSKLFGRVDITERKEITEREDDDELGT